MSWRPSKKGRHGVSKGERRHQRQNRAKSKRGEKRKRHALATERRDREREGGYLLLGEEGDGGR